MGRERQGPVPPVRRLAVGRTSPVSRWEHPTTLGADGRAVGRRRCPHGSATVPSVTVARPHIDVVARRARLAIRQHLGPGAAAASVEDAAGDIAGLHATDPLTVYLAAWARVPGISPADVGAALYDRRSLVRLVGMRRTMFAVPIELAGIIASACTASITKGERPRFERMLREAGVTDDPRPWIEGVEAETVAVLERLGEATAAELTREVPGLREQMPFGVGREWAGTVGVSTRLLFLLAAEGRIIRGRPKGTIASSLYRWVPMDRWVPGGLPAHPVEVAQAELVRRYLRAFGPARLEDVRWWTGWTVAEVRRALAAIGAVEVDLGDGATGLVTADDAASAGDPEPGAWVALLPSLDPTVMGWKVRDWYLGEHAARLFDRNGNAGPTIWVDGRVVGGWAQGRDGEVVTRLLEDVGREAARGIDARASELREWLGPIRFVPRFRTPLETELLG